MSGGTGVTGLGIAEDMVMTFWLNVALPATNQAASEGQLTHLYHQQHHKFPDMLLVVWRLLAGLQNLFKKDFLPIIMAKTRTAWIIMVWAHYQDHAGVNTTTQTSMKVA